MFRNEQEKGKVVSDEGRGDGENSSEVEE